MKFFSYLVLYLLTFSCSTTYQEQNESQESTNTLQTEQDGETVSELTQEQQDAFDALNTLQTSTDHRNRLYSTFANLNQPCYPADTSFVISQAEFLIVMQEFVSRNCQNLSAESRNELAATAVMAQKSYTVMHCKDNYLYEKQENQFPMTGTWVLPNILELRDVILVW